MLQKFKICDAVFQKKVDFPLSGKCILMLQEGVNVENKRGLRENRTK